MDKIIINLQEDDLSEKEISIIKDCLGIEEEAKLEEDLGKLAKAAFMEYVKMLTESGMPTKAEEMKQERLLFLLKYFFADRIPDENDLSLIFQITQSQSRTLLKNTKSRFRTKIEKNIRKSLLKAIEKETKPDIKNKMVYFECKSSAFIEELNSIIRLKASNNKPIQKKPETAGWYGCSKDTHEFLIKELNK